MPATQRAETLNKVRKIQAKIDIRVVKRINEFHFLVCHLDNSSRARTLEKRAERLSERMHRLYGRDKDGVLHPSSTNRKQAADIDKQVDEIFRELRKLPAMPLKRFQRERDEFPEVLIPSSGVGT